MVGRHWSVYKCDRLHPFLPVSVFLRIKISIISTVYLQWRVSGARLIRRPSPFQLTPSGLQQHDTRWEHCNTLYHRHGNLYIQSSILCTYSDTSNGRTHVEKTSWLVITHCIIVLEKEGTPKRARPRTTYI